MAEIGLSEAAERLHRSPEVIAKKAIETNSERGAKKALQLKLLPGRKVAGIWLFQPKYVAAFGRIKRPAGRPAG